MQNQDFSFEKATKTKCKLRMAIIGPSGSGKTYTSLLLAKELGNNIALIDTERGSARKYSDIFSFSVLELDTFHPDNYMQAIALAEKEGFEVLIIDSLSHAWNGTNGALDLVDKAAARMKTSNSFAAWRQVTPLHNKLIDTILKTNLHIIVTMRAKTEFSLEKNEKGKTVIRKIGLQPVQWEGLEYEFDICGDMDLSNTMTISKTRYSALHQSMIKKPDKELALTIREWLNNGEPAQKKPSTEQETKPQTEITLLQVQLQDQLKDLFETGAITEKKRDEYFKKITDPNIAIGLLRYFEKQFDLIHKLFSLTKEKKISSEHKSELYRRIMSSGMKGLSTLENELQKLEAA
ncbi:MAG: AAA family ATPase [Armatimonadetes bacterium]|nr:AAA family ATPase [Armatimonadota bacterium]